MENKRLALGLGWGLVATLVLSIPILILTLTGLSPNPKPVPLAIMTKLLGEGIPQPLLMLTAVAAHLAYGSFWGAVLAAVARPVTIWKGLLVGIVVYLIAGLVVMPFLGWGFFGFVTNPLIPVLTLAMHLLYGGVVGWLGWLHDHQEYPVSLVGWDAPRCGALAGEEL